MKRFRNLLFLIMVLFFACGKNTDTGMAVPVYVNFISSGIKVNGIPNLTNYTSVNLSPIIKFSFTAPISHLSATNVISFKNATEAAESFNINFENNDSIVIIQPSIALSGISKYTVTVPVSLASQTGGNLTAGAVVNITTAIDSTDKFPQISDSALLTLIQQQTFKYFWDFGHPISGMARERNSSGDVVTTGGTGFGIMAMLAGIQRNFISRTDGLSRINTIVSFLTNKAIAYHGAFPHWINGATGATVPFSAQDDGADLVETSYLMQGLLCARQYFNSASDANELAIRSSINNLWNAVQWNWFRQGVQNTLYWHWSPTFNWSGNQQITGWNEALITYVLAASSTNYAIPKSTYDSGWATNGSIKNGNTYYGFQLPLGPAKGGPLFFAHYSFLGINPNSLTDIYADYFAQNVAHSKINYSYCVANPSNYNGYSNVCWGLTASDEQSGYSAHSPTNDDGVISPTAAISSLPYTPTESMNALKFFYYKMGDKLWGQYGFYDAFNLTNIWFANSYLAIDQGPEIVMIENYRSSLLWNLFMSCPEVKTGMKKLGFQSPNL